MAKSESDAGHSLGQDRATLINDRLLDMYEIRAKCERAKGLNGTVPNEHRLALHNSIRDVYLAIRPLRNEGPVEDWWSDVILSERWGEYKRVGPSHESAILLGQDESGDPVYGVWVPYSGLDTLDELRDIVSEGTEERGVFGGEKVETVANPQPPDYDILLDISTTLDDAAARLGFVPNTKTPDETEPDPI